MTDNIYNNNQQRTIFMITSALKIRPAAANKILSCMWYTACNALLKNNTHDSSQNNKLQFTQD